MGGGGSASADFSPPVVFGCEVEGKKFSNYQQLLGRDVKQFREGLASKARRLLYHSTLGSRVIKTRRRRFGVGGAPLAEEGLGAQARLGRRWSYLLPAMTQTESF